MEHKTILWIIWSISALLFIFGAMLMGIFAFASAGAPSTSLMERAYYTSYYRVLFLGLPLFQLATIILALYALRHAPPFIAYLIIFLPYLLLPCVVAIGQHKGSIVGAEAKKLRTAFYESPQLSELENRVLKLEFFSDAGNRWPQTIQQMEHDGFARRENLNRKASLQELTSFYSRWDDLSAEQTVDLQGYSNGNDTIYMGNMDNSGNFLLAATATSGNYLRRTFDTLPWPKFDKAALQEIWRNNTLKNVSQFLQFWPPEKGGNCRQLFVEIEQALKQGSNARATTLFGRIYGERFWDSIPYSLADTTTGMENIEFQMYKHAVQSCMDNLKAACFFTYESKTPLLSTADSLCFLNTSNAGSLWTTTPEEIHREAQKQYEYRMSPPPANLKEYIQYIKNAKEENQQ